MWKLSQVLPFFFLLRLRKKPGTRVDMLAWSGLFKQSTGPGDSSNWLGLLSRAAVFCTVCEGPTSQADQSWRCREA